MTALDFKNTGTPTALHTLAIDFKLQKRGQFFIGTHNETLSVGAMCIEKTASQPSLNDGRE